MAYRRGEMWSEEHFGYERLPRERLPPRPEGMQYTIGSINYQEPESSLHCQDAGYERRMIRDDYHRVVNFAPKKLSERPGEYRYDYGHSPVGYRDYGEGRGLAYERRSGPPQRIDDPGYRWSREEHPPGRQPEYRDIRDGIRRKPAYPHYARERSPHKRDSPYFRESPVGRRDSPPSRSGSSVSSRSYSPERSKAYAFHQSQHSRNKERAPSQSLKTSRDVSPTGTAAVTPSKPLDKSSRLSENELAEAASRWASEKTEKTETSSVPEISEYEAAASEPLYAEHHEEPAANVADNNELFEDSQHVSRAKAITAKTKEIEQVYRQDCETFGAVVKMLIEKDHSLEKPIQFSLRQNLHEIGERCIEELKHFIAEYDARSQEFEEP
ncbi:periphilin-1 isoform X2 [Sceloporus undulatus]|uniref:periphilin-1 isoform X2 n=1 Tax=Sceloporus undulatus TaxID=8520 RepID=UPI001C4ADF22|nr:periphilin-1 isoform X2 [Sceloporus undulatus]